MSVGVRRAYYISVVLLAAAMVAVIALRAPSRLPQTPPDPEAVPEQVVRAGPVAKAAYTFLMSEDLAAEPLDALAVDFLGRRFGIEELRWYTSGAVANLLAIGGYERLYIRMAMPAADLPGPVRDMSVPSLDVVDSIAYYPLRALHCDRFPLEPDFLEGLGVEAGAGGYRTTHSALALLWGYEQGCIDEASTRNLYEAHLQKISEVLAGESFPGDLYAESLAFVEFMSDVPVSAELVERLEAVQTENGSFLYTEGEPSGSTHTTLLALWALLERTDPGRPPGDWIVMPGPPAGPPLMG